MLTAWILFPLVLAALTFGCGLLLEAASGVTLPRPLLLPAGLAVVIVASLFPPLFESTAFLSTPLVVVLAAVGYGLAWPFRRRALDWWAAAVGVATFGAFGAPVLLSGQSTFAGYIKLDDTATYLAMLDRYLAHGYNIAGLAASTYERTLATSLSTGYPMGSLMPLGVGHKLVGTDSAWLWQPYLSFLAVAIALGIYVLAEPLVRARPLRALVAVTAACAALLYGYALWGGIKELAEAALLVLLAALLPRFLAAPGRRAAILPAVVGAATLGVQSAAGAAWLLVPALIAGVFLFLRKERRASVEAAGVLVVATGVLAIPTFAAATMWFNHTGAFTSGSELGNLDHPLNWTQIFGIWPSGDFRNDPVRTDVAGVLIALVVIGALLALGIAAWRRSHGLTVYAATALVGSSIFWLEGSPWIGGKAIAIASPLFLALALTAAGWIFERGRRVEAVLAVAAIVFGVAWSDSLAYHDVFLAPSTRLTELEAIGQKFAGQGPTLETDYEPYGARHFLRKLDAEEPSELRVRPVLLRTGYALETGATADLDEFDLASVLVYRTLVVRVSPAESRPPSVYQPVAAGRYYQVWQRSLSGGPTIVDHLPLGDRFHAAAVPNCADVLRLAREAGPAGRLATVVRPPNAAVQLDGSAPGTSGRFGEPTGTVALNGAAQYRVTVDAPQAGVYDIGLDGEWRSLLEVLVDGHKVAAVRHVENWPAEYEPLATVRLAKGTHSVTLRYTGPDVHPGSAGDEFFGAGPLVVGRPGPDLPVTYVAPSKARTLCGKSLDWVEALKP